MSAFEVGPEAARRFALLMENPTSPSGEITTPNEDVAGAAEPVVLPERLDALAPEVRTGLDAYAASVDSTALVVLHDGSLVHEWYAEGTGRATLRPSQSMHKSLVGTIVLRCVADGVIPGLDASASTWLHEWDGDERSAITVDHLLQMASGLEQPGMSMQPDAAGFQWLFGDDTTRVVLGYPAAEAPGARFDYNNLNSQALGVLLERATGERYASLLARLLWQPMGAAAAEVWLDSLGGQAATSCCLNARAYDWALFGELLRTRGTVAGRAVVDPSIVDLLCEPSPSDACYARQIWLGDGMDPSGSSTGGLPPVGRFTAAEPFAEPGTIVACGFAGQRVYVARESGVVLVRMGPPTGTPRFQQHWDNTLLLNTVVRAVTDQPVS